MFSASASVSCASAEIAPCEIAPVENRRRIVARGFDLVERHRVARRDELQQVARLGGQPLVDQRREPRVPLRVAGLADRPLQRVRRAAMSSSDAGGASSGTSPSPAAVDFSDARSGSTVRCSDRTTSGFVSWYSPPLWNFTNPGLVNAAATRERRPRAVRARLAAMSSNVSPPSGDDDPGKHVRMTSCAIPTASNVCAPR